MFQDAGGGGLTQVESEQMTSAAIAAGETAVALDQMLKNLMDNLSPLQLAWTGVAGTAFNNIKLAVDEQARNLYRALTAIGDDLGVSSTQYAMTDDEIAQDLAPLGNMDTGEVTRLLDGNTTEVSEVVESGGSQTEITEAMNT